MKQSVQISIEDLEDLAYANPSEWMAVTFCWLGQRSWLRISVLLHELFQQVDEELFSQAQHEPTQDRRTRIAQDLREVREHRPELVECFTLQVQRNFEVLHELGRLLPPSEEIVARDQAETEGQGDAEPADAVEAEGVTRSLEPCSAVSMQALDNMQMQANDRFFRSLNELNQHLGELQDQPTIELANNPLSPENLCRCFQFALNLLDVDDSSELTICELFDRYVISQMKFVYDYVNNELRKVATLKETANLGSAGEAGQLNQLFSTVKGLLANKRGAQQSGAEGQEDLSQIRLPVRQSSKLPDRPSVAVGEPQDMVLGDEVWVADDSASREQTTDDSFAAFAADDAVTELREVISESDEPPPVIEEAATELIVEDLADASGDEPEDYVDIPDVILPPLPELADGEILTIQTVDILAVLTDMQREAPDEELFEFSENDGQSAVNHVLMSRLAKRRPEYADAPFNEDDEGTVDLVDLVFDFVLHDHNLPGPLQAMLARLQVPYLRVALLDWQLFALADHPARKLLDELARAAQGWSAEADEELEIYQRIELVSNYIMQDFSGQQAAYFQLLDSFTRFMTHFEERAGKSEKQAVAAMRERERLTGLKAATVSIRERMGSQVFPDIIDELLRRSMPEVLVAHWLDYGSDSEHWREALELVEDLVASAQTRDSQEAVQDLEAVLPRLLRRLEEGFDLLAVTPEKRQQAMAALEATWRAKVGPEFADQLEIRPLPEGSKPTSKAAREAESDIDFDQAVELILGDAPEAGTVSAESLHEALAGSWFEFHRDDGPAIRAKLSWEMPVGSKFLFVDQGGKEIAEKTLPELAGEIRLGQAVILESIPLFERALSTIADRLLEQNKANTLT
jgi:hypothetical protein